MNWYKKEKYSSKIIQMTPAEQNWASWAIDPMSNMWCDKEGAWDRDGEIYEEINLPRIEGAVLFLSDIPEINEDLLYRLEEQATATAECDAGSEQQISARCRSAFNLANKIRSIL
jgi:hypothetical protein